jgi:hypothetical protein
VALAAEQQLGAALARIGHVALDLLDARQVDERPHVDVVGEAVGHHQPCHALGEAGQEVVVDPLLHEDPVGRDAGLPELRYLQVSAPAMAASRSASSKTMNGALPPSSSETFLTCPAHWAMSSLPTSVDP